MESTENVYYSENPEIIEEEHSWGIENVVIVDNENLNWQEEGSEITVNYVDASENPNETLTEKDVYLSANAEDSVEADKSEYYSILETTYQGDDDFNDPNVSANIIVNVNDENEMILPDTIEEDLKIARKHESDPNDIIVTSNDEYVEEEISKENVEENLQNQVVLYSTDDPNEMYAVQIADDGNGNFQKYKYKVRYLYVIIINITYMSILKYLYFSKTTYLLYCIYLISIV